MRFEVLGPLRVIREDRAAITLASAAQRRLVAALIVRAGEVASTDWLAELLQVSAASLRTSVSRLRAVLGYDVLVTEAPGYLLRAEDVDAHRFEALIDAASTAAPADAIALLMDALSLWRGDAYAEFGSEDWCRIEVARLEERRTGATEDLIERRIRSGDHATAIAELTPHIGAHPFRDRPRALLMQALAADGRRTDAVRQFHSYRAQLLAEVGTEPGPDLVQLEREIVSGTEIPAPARATPAHVPRLPTGTVTFLLTDVAGSTRQWVHSEENMARAIVRHYEIIDHLVAEHGGARPIEQGEGDSTVAVFTSPTAAVNAALDIQRAFRDEVWPTVHPVSLRVALHTGEARLRDESNYSGISVILPARMRDLASPGQVLASSTTRDLVHRVIAGEADEVELIDLGEYHLRDLDGPERIFQLSHPDLASHFAPLRSSHQAGNLPVPGDSFIGRREEIAAIQERLASHRLVTLTGPGGAGKTRLAIQAAASLPSDDDVWWLDLTPLGDAGAIHRAAADVVGAKVVDDKSALDAVVRRLEQDAAIVVIDNCEHHVEVAARLASRIVSQCPRVSVLATSRSPLDLAGEEVWAVPPLTLPDNAGEDAARSDAVRLFVERGRQVRPDFDPSLHPDAVAEICRRLDGLPLAIELAAARLRALDVPQILAGLDDALRLLTTGPRSSPERHRTLTASIEWSAGLLSDGDRATLHRLCAFADGFTLEAAAAVCARDRADVALIDTLEHLLDVSLLVRMPTTPGSPSRLRQLETVRQYGAAQLTDEERAEVDRRHAEHFAALVKEMAPLAEGPSELDLARRLRPEDGNLRLALTWLRDHQPDRLPEVVNDLAAYWSLVGANVVAEDWLGVALASLDDQSHQLRARLHAGRALVRENTGSFRAAAADARSAIDVGAEIGDSWSVGRGRWVLGNLSIFGEIETCQSAMAAAVSALKKSGDQYAHAYARLWQSVGHLVRGDIASGFPLLREAAPHIASLDNPTVTASYGAWQAWTRFHDGDLDGAVQVSGEVLRSEGFALALQREFMENLLSGVALRRGEGSAVIEAAPARIDDQRRRGEETAAMVQEQGLSHDLLFADLELALGYSETIIARSGGFGGLACHGRISAAWSLKALGDSPAAHRQLAAIAEADSDRGWPLHEVRRGALEAGLVSDTSPSDAVAAGRRAVELARRYGLIIELPHCLEALGVALGQADQVDEALRCLAEADDLLARAGVTAPFLPLADATAELRQRSSA